MGECDYLNTRVRAMGSELLPVEFFEETLGLETEELPIDALLASAYGPALRVALTQQAGITAVEAALRRDLAQSFARVRAMAPPGPRALLDTQLARWDVQNILAVLRAIATRAKPRDIASALLPAGTLPEAQLAELALSPDAVSVTRKLATWNYTFAFDVHDERRLYEAYYRWALSVRAGGKEDRAIVRSLLEEQIDLANVKAVLHLIKHRDAKEPGERFESIPGGRLHLRFLARLARSPTLEDAFSVLDESYFALGIEKGILAYGESRSLGVMERFLEEMVIHAGCRLYRQDLLSISVPIGYLWRKYNETVNLRALCRGRSARMPSNAIRKELLLV